MSAPHFRAGGKESTDPELKSRHQWSHSEPTSHTQVLLGQSKSERTRLPAQPWIFPTPPPTSPTWVTPLSPGLHLSQGSPHSSLWPPTYPHSCHRHCSVRSEVAETSCRWSNTSISPSARWSAPPGSEGVAGTWNCLCCLRVGGEKDGSCPSLEPGAPARGKPLLPGWDKRSLRKTFWGANIRVKFQPKVGINIKNCYYLLRLLCVKALHTCSHTVGLTQLWERISEETTETLGEVYLYPISKFRRFRSWRDKVNNTTRKQSDPEYGASTRPLAWSPTKVSYLQKERGDGSKLRDLADKQCMILDCIMFGKTK